VCGHAVYVGGQTCPVGRIPDDESWELMPYQTGEGRDFVEHIRRGVEAAHADPSALLLFSGGQTRYPQILSEGQSYFQVADAFDFWGHRESARPRTTTEEFSLDSYHNCLYGLARFAECTGRLPLRLTIISWAFKRKRFQLHVEKALHWSRDWVFLGVGSPEQLAMAELAEADTRAHFETDMTGHGPVLGLKKAERNRSGRVNGYAKSVPCMEKMLEWTGTTPVPRDIIPWK
jgi:hypothetical protein